MLEGVGAYPHYQECDGGWYGQLPTGWKVLRSKYLFREVDERSMEGLETHLSMSQKLGLVPSSMVQRTLTSASYAGGKLCEPEDIVLNRLKAHLGVFARAKQSGVVSPDYTVLRPADSVNARYFVEVLRSPSCRGELRTRAKGIVEGFWRLYTDDFYDIRLPVPPPQEQTAIIKFVEYASREIRRYVQAKLKLIRLLEEQRQSIIHRAVTRGLEPGALFKPSGIGWLGDVPDHWEVRRLKTLFKEVNKRSETGAETLLSLRMHRGLVPHEDVSDKPISASALVGYKHAGPGQLVMNRMRAAIGIFGVPSQEGLVSPDYAVFDAAVGVEPSYYLSLFKTAAMCSEFRIASRGLGTGSSGFMRLYTDQFGKLWVPLPPLEEQKNILKSISVESSTLDAALFTARSEVGLLREYQTRLTADVVTGTLDVRKAAFKLPDVLGDRETNGGQIIVGGGELDEDGEN